MDPLSITASVAALLGACIKVASTLKSFRDASLHVDTKVKGLINEVDTFVQTLQSMRNTLNDSKVQHSSQLTGHIGDHWRSINECIKDGLQTVQSLQLVLQGVDKSVRLFGTVRKQLRFREATEEIAIYQQQIRSYRDTIQLSLQTAIFWNSVSTKDASSETLPKLDALALLIRNLGRDLNRKLVMFEGMVESPARDARIRSIQSLQSCVRTSFDVVSSASTTLGASDTRSVLAPSDYMDIFPARRQSVMLRWLADTGNTTRYMNHSQALGSVYGEFGVIEDSDSEAELEVEMIQLQLQKGKELVQNGNQVTAGKFLTAGISKLKHHRSRYLDAERKIFMLDDLLQPLEEQENWVEAKRVRLEKLSVLSSDMTTQSDRYLEETLGLVEFLLRARDINEGRIYARKCIKAYRKLGADGIKGLKQALELMITACRLDGDEPEEEVYKAMLAHLDGTSESDNALVEDSEPTLPAELDGSSAAIASHSPQSGKEAISFGFNPNSFVSKEATGEKSRLSPPVSVTDRVGTIFRTTAPPETNITFTLTGDGFGQHSETIDTAGKVTDEYRSIESASAVTTPSSYTNTTDEEAGILGPIFESHVASEDTFSGLIDSIFNRLPNSQTNGGRPDIQDTKHNTPLIKVEEPFPLEAQNGMETNERSSYELDVGTVATSEVDSNAHRDLLRSSSAQMQRAFSWEVNEPKKTDLRSDCQPYAVDTTKEEPHRFAEIDIKAYAGTSMMLSHFMSTMNEAPIHKLPDSTAQFSPNLKDNDNLTKVRFPFIDMEDGGDGTYMYNQDQISTANQKHRSAELDDLQQKVRVTTVILGPSYSGKSSLIHAFTSESREKPEVNNGLMAYCSTITETTTMQPIDMVIWDTSGEIADFHKLKGVQNVDCVVLCMTVDSPDSINDIEDIWMPKIRNMYPGRPLVLAALRVDLRDDYKTLQMLANAQDQPLSTAEGKRIMDRIGAVSFFDCSVKSREGVQDLFHEVALQGLQAKTDLRRSRGLWDLTKRSFRRSWQF